MMQVPAPTEQNLPQYVLGGVIATSVLSFGFQLFTPLAADQLITGWISEWLLDFSTDLAMGGTALFAFRRMFQPVTSGQQLVSDEQLDSVSNSDEIVIEDGHHGETLDRDAANKQDEKRNRYIESLRSALTPEARQVILDRLVAEDIALDHCNLVDVDLEQANLAYANLCGANLSKVILKMADLTGCNLSQTQLHMGQLIKANLQDADLSGAILDRTYTSGANMAGVNLSNAIVRTSFWGVNFQNANFENADLRGAQFFRCDLSGAELQGANIEGAAFNNDTRLPDGNYRDRKTDLQRFVDVSHPNFWRS